MPTAPAKELPTLACVNGEVMPLADVKVSVLDRGFLFGDAIYEVIRTYRGKPWLFQEHMDRLRYSLGQVRIAGVDVDRIGQRAFDLLRRGGYSEAYIYMQVTRGAAPTRKHAFPAAAVPFELIWVNEVGDPYAGSRHKGATVITHPDIRWGRCDIKSTNLLGNVLAIQAAAEAGSHEAILYKPDGTLTEGTHSSFFVVRDGTLLTTPKGNAILPGITRDYVLKLAAQEGIPVREQFLHRDDLATITELFFTGTGSEVFPMTHVDGRPVGGGEPGPVTRRLQRAYTEAVRLFVANG